jgi:hypothetical protein
MPRVTTEALQTELNLLRLAIEDTAAAAVRDFYANTGLIPMVSFSIERALIHRFGEPDRTEPTGVRVQADVYLSSASAKHPVERFLPSEQE